MSRRQKALNFIRRCRVEMEACVLNAASNQALGSISVIKRWSCANLSSRSCSRLLMRGLTNPHFPKKSEEPNFARWIGGCFSGECRVLHGNAGQLPQRGADEQKGQKTCVFCPSEIWRKGRDSNPRYGISVCRLSRAVQSTTLPSFHDVLGCELQRRGEGFSAGWAGARNREAGIYQRTKGLSRVTE